MMKRVVMNVSGVVWLAFMAVLLAPARSFSVNRLLAVKSSSTLLLNTSKEDEEDDDISLEAFQARKRQQQEQEQLAEEEEGFDGYALRDVIVEKWGLAYDVDFNSVDTLGFRCLYLNIMPFHLEGRRFRHETEMDYLCHLQAVAEILEKYNQIGFVLAQIDETKKKPRAGTSPLVAVPLRLDLTIEQVQEITGY